MVKITAAACIQLEKKVSFCEKKMYSSMTQAAASINLRSSRVVWGGRERGGEGLPV